MTETHNRQNPNPMLADDNPQGHEHKSAIRYTEPY